MSALIPRIAQTVSAAGAAERDRPGKAVSTVESRMVLSGLQKLYPVRRARLRSLFGSEEPRSVHAVDDVTFQIAPGSIVAFVGESGCGKTTLGKMVALYERPTAGRLSFREFAVPGLSRPDAKAYRRKVQMVFQDPYDSLDPRYQVGETCMEPLLVQGMCESRDERLERAMDALQFVGLAPPKDFFYRYPHELSGGQRQRVAIARALVLSPSFIVADEPVSMLDVSLRAGVLRLFDDWRNKSNVSIMFITHDLAVARYISDSIAVMYLGEIVESGPTDEVLLAPCHPYTRELMAAVPEPNPFNKRARSSLAGDVPSPVDLPRGCRFASRCPESIPECYETHPSERLLDRGHRVRCLRY